MLQGFDKHVYRILLGLTVVVLVTGTVVYHFVEKLSYIDAYYFSVVTLATVGYGDITPHTTFGKIFTTFYILTGVGIITTFFSYSIRRRAFKLDQRHGDKKEKQK
jgi:voltage-gated potassium channel Kch